MPMKNKREMALLYSKIKIKTKTSIMYYNTHVIDTIEEVSFSLFIVYHVNLNWSHIIPEGGISTVLQTWVPKSASRYIRDP